MIPDLLERLFKVLDIAVFERRLDGAFVPLTAVPDWMVSLSRDGTFPFLGDFLADAQAFWDRGTAGRVGSGLLAVEDDAGQEFHVEVWAANARGSRLLLFERPADADGLRRTLQRAREEVLAREAAERTAARRTAEVERIKTEVRTTIESIRGIIRADQRAGGAGDATADAVLAAAVALADRLGLPD